MTVDPSTLPASLKNRLVLPAKPLAKRPYTLEPSTFREPETVKAYQAARDVPEVLEHMPCYCGCFSNSGHRNNLDCFKDNHGEHCALCRAIAIESKAMTDQGLPVEQINIAINEKMMAEERGIIDDTFLVSLFKVLSEHPNMTATQVIELVNEKGMLVAPTLGRQL
mgnify:CR=1 FL=1